jgi:hypothetical protein
VIERGVKADIDNHSQICANLSAMHGPRYHSWRQLQLHSPRNWRWLTCASVPVIALHVVLGLAAGLLLGLVAFDLLPEVFEM